MKNILTLTTFIFLSISSFAQFEVDYVKLKDYKAFGFGGFINVAKPVSDADFAVLEVGGQAYINSSAEELYLIPIIFGYRYTFDRSGYGFYAEPNLGYTFGGSTIMVYDEFDSPIGEGDNWLYRKPSGPTAGLALGYLFNPDGKVQLNLALKYQRGFANDGTNVFSFRVSHAFTIGRRDRD